MKQLYIFLLFFVVSSTTLVAQAVSLVNADFEAVANGKPVGWSLVTKPAPEPSKVWGWQSVGKDDAPSGAAIDKYALQVWAWATDFELEMEKSKTQVTPNEIYRVKLHFWQDGKTGTQGHLYVKIRWLDANGKLLREDAFADTETTISEGRTHSNGDFGWDETEEGNIHCDLMAPPSAAFVSLRLIVGKWIPKDKPYYIDAISIVSAPKSTEVHRENAGEGGRGGAGALDMYSLEGKCAFLKKILVRGEDFWRDDHWVDHRNYTTWIGHSSTFIYYVLAHAAFGGVPEQIERIGSHYAWVRQRHWVPRIRAWVDDGDVMANACMALNVASGLSVGGKFLAKDLREQMEADLKDVCRWLATRNTAVLNNDDLRACNQDAIATAGLALSASYFDNDASFQRMALDKLRLIIKRSEGPFWIEGGVDKAYQISGESSFALAADLLWEELTLEDKRRVAEILMRPYAAGAMGLEKTRSESTLGAEEGGSVASAILARVNHPLIAADVRRTYTQKNQQGVRNPWWIFDAPIIAYYWGAFQNSALLANSPQTALRIGWGGQARLGMKIDEVQSKTGSVDQKSFLTSSTGVTALFGDTSGWGDHYALKNRKAAARPIQYNPGGLRYIGKERTVSVWADGQYDFPRLVYGDSVGSNGSLKLDSSLTLPGFVGSQYFLKQSVSDFASVWAGTLEQQYVVLGDYLLGRIEPDNRSRQLPSLRHEFTIRNDTDPTTTHDNRLASWQQGSLYEKDAPTTHALLSINSGALELVPDTLKPYLVNEPIRHWVNKGGVSFVNAKPQFELSRVRFPISSEQPASWFLLASGSTRPAIEHVAGSIKTTSVNGVETVTFVDGSSEYGIVFLAGGTKTPDSEPVEITLPSGTFALERPIMAVFQCIVVKNGQPEGFFIKARGARWNNQPLVTSDLETSKAPAQVSTILANGIRFVDVADGAVSFPNPDEKPATSLITGKQIDLGKPVENDRFWF